MGGRDSIGKSFAIWCFETACEIPLLMGLLYVVLGQHSQVGDGLEGILEDLRFLLFATLVFIVGSGFIITTAIAAVVLRGRYWLMYSVAAAFLFVGHEYFFLTGSLPGSPHLQLRTGGAVIVFGCTFVGSHLWRRWAG